MHQTGSTHIVEPFLIVVHLLASDNNHANPQPFSSLVTLCQGGADLFCSQ
jgi:hypothetical protein